jgi:predicted ATPase
MRLQAVVGDRAGALRTYHKCATVLERELDVEPSPETRELYERLLAVDEAATPPERPPRRRSAVSPLIGRDAAWARLRKAWRVASAGRAHLVLISGEAGIGKTRLAEELLLWAGRQGITTAIARCYPTEGELAYGPIAAWLRELPLGGLDPVWRTEVSRILPDLLTDGPDASRSGPPAEPWQRRRFFEALTRAVLDAGEPLLLVIDALQWCDHGTLEWLHYLLRFDSRARLLVMGAYRPSEAGEDHPLSSLLHQLRRDDLLTEIELSALSRDETGVLASNLADRDLPPELVSCLYRETEGNPLFIAETVRAGLPDEVREMPAGGFMCLPRPLPSRVKDALVARLDQLTPLARSLAELAATIGRDFTFRVLMAASDAGEDRVVRGLDELWQARIVREQGEDAYDFSHDKLREVTYDEMSEARRRMLHRRVARALETVHAQDVDAIAAQIAAHYERAGEPEEAIVYYKQAAEAARRLQAEQDLARYRRRVSRLVEVTGDGA